VPANWEWLYLYFFIIPLGMKIVIPFQIQMKKLDAKIK
jgi:hypothetical protein